MTDDALLLFDVFPAHVGYAFAPPLPFVLHHHDRLHHSISRLAAAAPDEAAGVTLAIDDMLARLTRVQPR